MTSATPVTSAKVMAKGQVTIPKEVLDVLGVGPGHRVAFIVDGDTVRIANAALYAMHVLQQEMVGEAQRAGLQSEEDVTDLIRELRQDKA
ncbi:MAG: AbrB/MazE/SpoVT family DNA-binding domain-containing protein [Sutterellaceae bacterium]|nr:AbrB/MazE/SpoVT family DNA-binding domain-containing protein [Sutterellaceae bacterium]